MKRVSVARSGHANVLVAICLSGHLGFAGAADHVFPNPMTDRDAADPGMLIVQDNLYVYSTGCIRSGGGAFPIRVSKLDDRTSWTSVGSVFTTQTLPEWCASGCKYWAPEVHNVKGRYICYYSAPDRDDRFCIGAALSNSPEGPFIDIGKPLVSDSRIGLIDAGYFQDPVTSKSYLLWKEDKNALDPQEPTGILAQELADDGITLRGKPHLLIYNDSEWEHDLVEAPTLIFRKGYYYLFFSANAFNHDRYGVGVARARTVMGPYKKYGRNPIMKTNDHFNGPGHQFMLEEKPGKWTMFYHARHGQGSRRSRLLMSDPVRWTQDGWPTVSNGHPSNGWKRSLLDH